jgi:hypothetical protein
MAILGGAVTNKFVIGNFELRVGPQEMAGKLTSAHSVGVIDRFAVRDQQQSADLTGLFPQELIDTDIVSQTTQLTATLREFSPRNLNILLGNGLAADNNTVSGTTTSVLSSGAVTSATLASFVATGLYNGTKIQATQLNHRVWAIDSTNALTPTRAALSNTEVDSSNSITFAGAKTPWITTPVKYLIASYRSNDTGDAGSGVAIKDFLPLYVGKIGLSAPTAEYQGNTSTTGTVPSAVHTLTVYVSSATATAISPAMSFLKHKYIEFITVPSSTGPVTTDRRQITNATVSGTNVTLTLDSAPPTSPTYYRLRATNTTPIYTPFGSVDNPVGYVKPSAGVAADTVNLSSDFSAVSDEYNNMLLTVANKLFYIKEYTVASGVRTAKVSYIGPNPETNWPETGTASTLPIGSSAKITTITEAYSGVFVNDAGESGVTVTVTGTNPADKTVTFSTTTSTDFSNYTATIKASGGTIYTTVSDFSSTRGAGGGFTYTVAFENADAVSLIQRDDTIVLDASTYRPGVEILTALDDPKYKDITILKGTRLLLWDKSNYDEAQLVTVSSDSLPIAVTKDKFREITFTPGLAFQAHVSIHGDYGIALVDPVSMGNQVGVNYLSASLIMKDRSVEAPVVFDFWKVSVSSGLSLTMNATDFSSVDLVFDVLEPTAKDKSQIYPDLATTIDKHPLYRYSATPDR